MATLSVSLVEGPLGASSAWHPEGAGAVAVFEGVVRPREAGRELRALLYETYDPMTETELGRLARSIADKHRLTGLRVEHSRGAVPVGAVSFRLMVAAPRRKQALAAIDEFIDEMKQHTPIWKVPIWLGEDSPHLEQQSV